MFRSQIACAESLTAGQPGILKPDIVFFGQDLPKEFYDHIRQDTEACDLVVVIGSSLRVCAMFTGRSDYMF